jgi:hypothetical protein
MPDWVNTISYNSSILILDSQCRSIHPPGDIIIARVMYTSWHLSEPGKSAKHFQRRVPILYNAKSANHQLIYLLMQMFRPANTHRSQFQMDIKVRQITIY